MRSKVTRLDQHPASIGAVGVTESLERTAQTV